MNAQDVVQAASIAQLPSSRVCDSARTILPVLRALRDNASWTKPWVKVGLATAIGALEAYVKVVCPGPP